MYKIEIITGNVFNDNNQNKLQSKVNDFLKKPNVTLPEILQSRGNNTDMIYTIFYYDTINLACGNGK